MDEDRREISTEIVLLLDRSGSMGPLRQATVEGVNVLLREQRAAPGRARLTLVLFDHEYLPVHRSVPVDRVPDLEPSDFVPRGQTALVDAWGRAMAETEERLAALDEDGRPDRVLFVVVTDGQENASREHRLAEVLVSVASHRDQDGWTFLYLGANQDAAAVGASYGVPRGSTLAFSASPAGTRSALATLSGTITGSRSGDLGPFADLVPPPGGPASKKRILH